MTQELFEAIVVLLIGIVLLGAIYYLAPVVFSAIWTARKALKNVKSTAESELTRENIQGIGKEIQGFTKENLDGAARLSDTAIRNIRCYLSFSGKCCRRSFIVTILIGNFLIGIPIGFGLLAMTSDLAFVALLGGATVIAMVIASCWISWAASSRRMRDTGVNPWWTLALLVPPLNFAAMVFLLLVPSDEFAGRGV